MDKTNNLRDRLKGINKPFQAPENTPTNNSLTKVIYFFVALASVWGAQLFILNKLSIAPFSFWETSVILIAFLYITKFIKAKDNS